MTEATNRAALVALIRKSEQFDEEWYLHSHPDVAYSGLSAIEHYLRIGARLDREPNPEFDSKLYRRQNPEIEALDVNPFVHAITKLLHEQTARAVPATAAKAITPIVEPVLPVDEAYYLLHNPDVAAVGLNGTRHFERNGFREMRNPRADFDLWWYSQNYLLGTSDQEANALDHYNRVGAKKGYLPRPPLPVRFDPEHSKPLGANPRRICLFAAYDADGIVDDYVLAYLRDMARYADIYYLADCAMDAEEMAKLDGLVKGAWAERHGRYDFGSYSMLARDLVGWDRIEAYDEMILANDSCFLVHPLEETFKTMAAKPCAWWGLQATKGLISTKHQNKIPEDTPVPIAEVKEKYLSVFEADPVYDFHIGSYFMAFRRDVICDPDFRRVLDNVGEEASKLRIIRKYEIGLTRFLIGKGYEFDTLVDTISKQHPIFSERAFDLIDEGFPLLKRFFLTENHYKISGLAQWKSRIKRANPKADIALIQRNLYRVGDAVKLYNNFRIGQDSKLSKPPRSHEEMRKEDAKTPKYDDWWVFPVCSYSHLFSDNTRAVFERVKNDPAIKKIILTRSLHVEADGVNVVVLPLHSYEGQSYLLRARQVFLRHGVEANIEYPLSSDLHNFYNLWHGIPLKRIGYTSLDQASRIEKLTAENRRIKSVISASDVDRLAMTAAYWPLTFHDIWVTGLPRHDFILAEESDLPDDFHSRAARLKERLKGKKFLLFAPTFRADQENGYYSFSEGEVRELSDWLIRNGIIMGIREHMADKTRLYSSQLRGKSFINASERLFPDIELLYRHADMLLTDYSSCFIDYMLTGRPAISFAFDRDSYANAERGLFYDQEMVFPGPICTNFSGLMSALQKSIEPISDADRHAYDWKVSFFHKYRDTHNAHRVIAKVKDGYKGSKMLWQGRVPTGQRTATFVFSPAHQITNRYRIFNLMEHLQDLGWKCRAVSEHHLTADIARCSEVLIICRIPLNDTLLDICETHRLQGGKLVFDLDDLIHDLDAFSSSEYFSKRPKFASDFVALSEKTRQMIETADAVTVTTQALAESLSDLDKLVEVVPNSISSALRKKFDTPPAPRPDAEKVRICYLSGTATHSEDFAQCRDALTRILTAHPEVELHIVGKMDINGADEAGQDLSIIRHELMTYEALHEFLAGMDINLAPLAPSYFNDCKSELKIFDAALHAVPSIASPTRSYAAVINNGEDGVLAQSSQDWEDALARLICDPVLRHKMGTAAFTARVPQFSAHHSGRILAGLLNMLVRQTEDRLSINGSM